MIEELTIRQRRFLNKVTGHGGFSTVDPVEFGPININKRSFEDDYLNIKNLIRSGLGCDNINWLNAVTNEWGNGPHVVSDLKDGYWNSVIQFHRNTGYQVEVDSEFKSIWFAEKLEARAESYKVWLKYIASEDANYIPSYLHAWILEGLSRVGMYKSEAQSVTKRRKNDMYAFINLYPDCLAKAVTAMQTKIDNPSHQFDIDALNQIFKNAKNHPGFNILYSYFYEEKMKRQGDLSEVYAETGGNWRKYTDVSQADELTRILNAYPKLGWCIKGLATTRTFLKQGTIDIYFSHVSEECIEQMEEKFKDDPGMLENLQIWKEFGYPRICIRTKQGVIVEAKGCDENQEMDEVISNTSKLKDRLNAEYGENSEEFIKIDARLQRFNKLYVKYLSQQDFSHDEFIFLCGCSPRFFGFSRDSRVDELKKELLIGRDLRGADLRGVDLSGIDLGRVNLNFTHLEGADLRGTDLSKVNFYILFLEGALVNEQTKIDFLEEEALCIVDCEDGIKRIAKRTSSNFRW